ncbi:unnamed protein product, partial [Tuber aestivum]
PVLRCCLQKFHGISIHGSVATSESNRPFKLLFDGFSIHSCGASHGIIRRSGMFSGFMQGVVLREVRSVMEPPRSDGYLRGWVFSYCSIPYSYHPPWIGGLGLD